MQEFFNCVLTKHTLAFGAGTLIFLITILLVSRRVIGFILSLLLMLAALGAAWGIDRSPDAINYWNKYTPEALHLPPRLGTPANQTPLPESGKETAALSPPGTPLTGGSRVTTVTPIQTTPPPTTMNPYSNTTTNPYNTSTVPGSTTFPDTTVYPNSAQTSGGIPGSAHPNIPPPVNVSPGSSAYPNTATSPGLSTYPSTAVSPTTVTTPTTPKN